MANVIGSSAYYGSYSNDGSSLPNSGGPKREAYESFSAGSYNKGGFGGMSGGSGSGSGGMSFGESVMRSLQQSKKEEKLDPPSPERPATKLNLSKMNERKPEEKKNFNALSMKLVKPPEKKTAERPPEKKQETTLPSPQKPQQQKPKDKVDIMDIDFLSMETKPQTVNYSTSSDPFDLLGPQPQPQAPQQPQTPQQQHTPPQPQVPFFNSLNFGLTQTTPQAPQLQQGFSLQPTSQSGLNFSANTSFSGYNYSAPTQTVPAQSLGISLTPAPQPKSSAASSSLDLIDFSNFREQLAKVGQQEEKKSIVEQWNW